MGVPEQSPLVVADYVSLPPEYPLHSAWDALAIDQSTRDWLEARNAGDTARRIFQQLPTSREQMAEQLRVGSALAHGMSWDVVAHSYLLPGLRTAQSKI